MNGDGATWYQYAAAPTLINLLCQRTPAERPLDGPDVVFAEHSVSSGRVLRMIDSFEEIRTVANPRCFAESRCSLDSGASQTLYDHLEAGDRLADS